MTSISPIQVFNVPPLGKPAKDADYALGDSRPRVVQPGQKGPTCWYYAAILAGRERYGKTAPPSLEGRVTEKEVSDFRKSITELYNLDQQIRMIRKVNTIELFMDGYGFATASISDVQSHISQFLDMMNRFYTTNPESSPERHDFGVLEEFCSQQEVATLEDYKTYLSTKGKVPLFEDYLRLRGFNPDVEVQKYFQFNALGEINAAAYISGEESTQKMSETEIQKYLEDRLANIPKKNSLNYYTLLCHIVNADIYRGYGFKVAAWDPTQPIEQLIQSLQVHGRHLISGWFGPLYYKEPPNELKETIQGRKIYGWKKNTPRSEKVSDGLGAVHSVVVVGAIKNPDGTEYVLYADAQEGSDPQDPTSQNIYKVSYARFIEFICCVHGREYITLQDFSTGQKRRVELKTTVPSSVTGFHYALHM